GSRKHHVGRKGHQQQQAQHKLQFHPRPEDDKQKRWPDDIKLLLNTERPEMQQRLEMRFAVEIAALAPERYVGEETGAEEDVLAQLRKLEGQQVYETECQHEPKTNSKSRKEAADAPQVEAHN